MIRSFRGAKTQELWETGRVKKGFPVDIQAAALRKLRMLDAAARLEDLRSPPGNRLEALSGDRKGEHTIRVNDQFRVCFVWKDGDVSEIEITDYH